MVAAAAAATLAVWMAGCTPTEPVGGSPAPAPQATAPALAAPTPSVAAAQSSHATGREQQRVRILIDQVERAYAQGEADYRRGRLAEARTQFDRAVDLMLLSGLDLRGNAQLSEEFDRIVDQVNGFEMEALKRGNGFTTPEEETPGQAAADVTFKVDPNFVARAQADLATTKSDLPLVVNDYVAAYINFFANTKRGHSTLLHAFQRSGRYRAMIQRVMAEEGVPQDLIYLAVAESGFNPRAIGPMTRSGGRAGGMWQFMPSGNYGLVRNQYVDERFDPEKSTRASARYMKFIYEQLGDWYLTMAGYNWGAGNVQRAVQKTGYADFWELYKRHNLPAETANYVPEILAAIIIANHPTQYGFDDITLDPPVLTDTVTINYSIDLRLVSDLVGAPLDELEALNPSLLRRVTPPDASFDLHLPAGTATLYDQRVSLIPETRRNAWRYRRVKAGDTLASIAHEYHVSEADLAEANRMQAGDDVKNVEALAVPAVPAPVASRASAPAAPSSLVYKAHKGDTLVTIADRFGVSLAQLRSWNNLSGSGVKIVAGRKLRVSEPGTTKRAIGSRRATADADGGTEKSAAGKCVTNGRGKRKGGKHAAPCKVEPSSKAESSSKNGRRDQAEKSTKKESSTRGKHVESTKGKTAESTKSAHASSKQGEAKSATKRKSSHKR